ncbi:MAG: hypothetical protein ACK5OW_01840, partial [bacterium]
MRKKIELICDNKDCSKSYHKDLSEYKRNLKKGRGNFCSLSCVGKTNFDHLKGYGKKNKHKLIPDNRKDKYTGLREHLNRIKKRNKYYNITLDDLLEQWEKQNGICPYTKLKLVHPQTNKIKYKNIKQFFIASLDRIDSNMGYIKG